MSAEVYAFLDEVMRIYFYLCVYPAIYAFLNTKKAAMQAAFFISIRYSGGGGRTHDLTGMNRTL